MSGFANIAIVVFRFSSQRWFVSVSGDARLRGGSAKHYGYHGVFHLLFGKQIMV
jgi:hypothetical protein